MFDKIRNWIINIKRADELDTTISELSSEKNICKFESDTSDCSLVQELKSKQAMKKIVDADLWAREYVRRNFK